MFSRLLGFMILSGAISCIDRLYFENELNDQGDFIVEGYISDQPGPYKVKLYLPTGVDENVLSPVPVIAKEVMIADDAGNTEVLGHNGSGEYSTSETGIRGVVGRKYHVRIVLLTGEVFESTPEELLPVGSVTDVRFRFESVKPLNGPTQYGFRVFMDSENANGFVRWRFTGTFMVETFPEFRTHPKCRGRLPSPPPCSGYVWQDGDFERVGDCTCCYCWVNDTDVKPILSDEIIASNGTYKDIEMAYIPFDVWRFHFGKYMVKVEQMSLSKEAYEFWKIIRDQKDGSTSLFQPAFGKIRSNFVSHNSDRKAIGFFYATSIQQTITFIRPDDASIPVPGFDLNNKEVCIFHDECDVAWLNASRTPPREWE